jgi:meiotically up-regulated gene 157 (Mug157) protein
MINSMVRPADDACTYSFFIPANLFAITSLRQLAELATTVIQDPSFAKECISLAEEVESAAAAYGQIQDAKGGTSWAYEVDGYGNQLFMDDANVPSLLALPYLGYCALSDATYQRTRSKVLSDANPYFFRGKTADGVGSPHTGLGQIWPISLVMRALTSTDDDEIRQCLQWVKATHAGTGFMHESFDKDDATHFTRTWFAWANSLFGEWILRLSKERPALLRSV